MIGKFQTQLFVIILVIGSMGMLGALSFVTINMANSQSIILSNQTSNVTTPDPESATVINYPDNNRLARTVTANDIVTRDQLAQRALENAAADDQITSDEYAAIRSAHQNTANTLSRLEAAEANNDPLQFIPYEAIIKIKTSVDGACSNITSIECRDEFGFGSEVYTNVNNKIERIYLPGSEQGWTLTYYPEAPIEYLVKPSQIVPGNMTYGISTSDECTGVLKMQDNKTCTIKYTPLELM